MSTEKKEEGIGSMIKLGLILAAYAVASCTVLAVVNNITSPVIAANNERKANEAMRTVIAQAEDFVTLDPAACSTAPGSASTVEAVKLAKAGGKVIGGVVQISGPTYDHARIMIGVDVQGTVTGVQFLENTDSPGFGSRFAHCTASRIRSKPFASYFSKNASSRS